MTSKKPVVLCILDGWGIGPDPKVSAPAQANVPNFNRIWATCPHSTLTTFGPDVGLPRGQMGNSEVGHTNIGAGRVVAMDLGAIDLAIEDGTFATNPAVVAFAANPARQWRHGASDGGRVGWRGAWTSQSRIGGLPGMTAAGVPVALHAITDGRDVAPNSAAEFVAHLMVSLPEGARVATVIGRYWAMDRDNRWERVERAYDAMVRAKGEAAADAAGGRRGFLCQGRDGRIRRPDGDWRLPGREDGDGLFCLNFRSDRAREILAALADPAFSAFEAGKRPDWAALLGMVEYSDLPQRLYGDRLSQAGHHQHASANGWRRMA